MCTLAALATLTTTAITGAVSTATTVAAATGRAGKTFWTLAGEDRNFDLHQLFDVVQQAGFVRCAERDRNTITTGTGRTADTVHIGIRHFRQIVVEDMRHGRNVDAACSNVRRHQHLDFAILEALQRALALALALVAMDRRDLEADMLKMLVELFGTMLGAKEDDGAAIGVFRQRLLQKIGLVVLAGDEVNILLNLVGSLARRCHFHLDRIGQVATGEIGNRLRHGRRKEKRLTLGRHHLGNLAQIVNEAEIQHLVGFVENEMRDLGQRNRVARDQVEQAARRGNENVGALFQLQLLLVDRRTADNLVDAKRRLLHEGAQAFTDLVDQLARRR